MSTGPTSFLPPMQAAQSAKAAVQAVAVRLISTPSSLQNNPAPVRLEGTVAAQDQSSGALLVETERGIVELMLSNRQNLPKGMTIEIEIPAGRAPQNAVIRASPNSPQTAATTPSYPRSEAPVTSLERTASLDAETFEVVLQSRSSALQYAAANTASVRAATGDLQLGQFVRLIPIPPQFATNIEEGPHPQIPAPSASANAAVVTDSIEQILSSLVSSIRNLPQTDEALRPQLLALLSRISIPVAMQTSATSAQSNLIQNINYLLQHADLTQNSSSQEAPRVFNPTVPIDVQILGFQNASGSNTSSSSPVMILSMGGGATMTSPNTPATALQQTPPSSLTLSSSPLSASVGLPPSLVISSQTVAQGFSSQITIAQVVGKTPEGLPVVAVPAPSSGFVQSYVMQYAAQNISPPPSAEGAVSTPLLLSIQPQIAAASISTASGGQNWAIFQDVFLSLFSSSQIGGGGVGQIASPAAQAFAALLPSPMHPQNFGATALLFLSALQSGQIGGWMPENALSLMRQSARGASLLKDLSNDLATTARSATASLANDWRGVMIPLLWEQQIHKIPLYYKHLPDEGAEDRERKKRRLRFLFDLNLSRMGGVQVDGYMESQKLDLIVRTKSPLSVPMQSRMKQLYAGAVERSNLTGELSFQFKPEQWVDFSQPLETVGVEA